MQWPQHHKMVYHEMIKNLISCHEKYYIINVILTNGYHMEGKSILEHHELLNKCNTTQVIFLFIFITFIYTGLKFIR